MLQFNYKNMKMANSEYTVITIGVFLVIVGVIIRYKINKRRFNRRGPAGLQHFKNYEQAWLITLFERILMRLSFIMIICGLFFTIAVILF
jgi:hypothetical protein